MPTGSRFLIVFHTWVTFGEQKWVNSREPRGRPEGRPTNTVRKSYATIGANGWDQMVTCVQMRL